MNQIKKKQKYKILKNKLRFIFKQKLNTELNTKKSDI